MAAKRQGDTLQERRRKFIFGDPQKFDRVEVSQFRGMDLVRDEIDAIVERFLNFQDGIDLGGGAIFYGEMGSGKTHGVLYFLTRIEKYARAIDLRGFPRAIVNGLPVSLTPEDVHEAYALAGEYVQKRNQPIVLVYDNVITAGEGEDPTEFDNIREQLNIELSSLERRINGVYIILTTTFAPEQLDATLFRDGRIDDHIGFLELTLKGQHEMLRYALQEYRPPNEKFRVELAPDADLDSIAQLFEGNDQLSTPAGIVKGFRRAVVRAARRAQKGDPVIITNAHLIKETIRRLTGQLTEETLDEKSAEIETYHEAGHVVFARALGFTVQYVSIFPQLRKTGGLGRTYVLSPKGMISEEDQKNFMVAGLGGRVAEKLFGYQGMLSHQQDISDISQTAHHSITKLGGGKEMKQGYGCIVIDNDWHEASETMKQLIERDEGEILKDLEARAQQLVEKIGEALIKERIQRVATELLKEKILLRRQIEELLTD